jgi:hypothetical protein
VSAAALTLATARVAAGRRRCSVLCELCDLTVACFVADNVLYYPVLLDRHALCLS